ncbi:protein-tyrosine phosphatase, partial [Baffinella frigidus]
MARLKPPNLFGIVQPGIYRSNAPLDENLPFLERLNLRTVLFLSPEVLLRSVVDFFEEQNIKLHNLGLQAWRPEPNWTPICDEFVKEALEMMLDRRAHPVLVCCSSGILQTCPLIGCLRRIQNWSLTSILDEFR